MKKIKDPALFEKIRKFLTEDMPVLRKKSPNTVEAYRYTLNIYLVFLCEKHSKSLYNITVKDFSQKNILFFLDWLIEERGNKASTANLRLRHIKRFCRFLMDENILMISELSAIQKIAEIPNASEDTIKFLTIQETKLTDMKRKAVDKISAKENSVFKSDEKFKYADNEDVIRQLYGLM